MPATDIESLKTEREHSRLAAFEVAWIFLIFFLFAGSLPPDVGESHYLVKARHYWDPAWCAGDLFVESRDAHATFNWLFGWVTRLCSLTATAWVGRVLTWLLLAWTWQRLSWAVLPRPLVSLLSAGLMLLFLRRFHLAGEWVVGGVEAKGFAYALVFLALEAIARNRWRAALLFAGAAGAFHVLVGGWTAVAIGLAWLVPGPDRPRLRALLPAAAGGLMLAMPGLIPAVLLNWGVPKEVAREAARIYVFERLSHHLVFHLFPANHIARFQTLLVGWAGIAWMLRREASVWRLQLVVAAVVVIAAVGVAFDQAMVVNSNLEEHSLAEYQLRVAGKLRYYWYRMSDSLVPVGLALGIVVGLNRLQSWRPAMTSCLTIAAILLATANIADVCYWRSQQNLPAAILQPRPTADSVPPSWFAPPRPARGVVTATEWNRDWLAVCRWVTENMPRDAVFLTPREQQTFKWYAGRAEVANWKDVPQDARALIEWKKRLMAIYPRDRMHNRHDLAAFSDEELVSLAGQYGARYVIIDQTRAGRRLGLAKLYPQLSEGNASFGVYRVPEARGR